MSEKQETVADIIAEMHRFAKQHEYDHPDMDTNARGIEDYADRLEAAHERELAAVGNAAKLREALEALNCINTGGLKRLLAELVELDIFDGGLINKTISAVDKAKAALAAPPRNCDVGTPEEQAERFDSFCVSHYTPPNKDGVVPDGCDCPCYVRGKGCNVFVWTQMPYEEGGAE